MKINGKETSIEKPVALGKSTRLNSSHNVISRMPSTGNYAGYVMNKKP